VGGEGGEGGLPGLVRGFLPPDVLQSLALPGAGAPASPDGIEVAG
jgi:hypothetical protein